MMNSLQIKFYHNYAIYNPYTTLSVHCTSNLLVTHNCGIKFDCLR